MKWTRFITLSLAALLTFSSMASETDYIVTGTNKHRILEHIITNEVCAREYALLDEASLDFQHANTVLMVLADSYIPSVSATKLARMQMADEDTKDVLPEYELKLSKAIKELKTARDKNQYSIEHELKRVDMHREMIAFIKEQDSPKNLAKGKAIRDSLKKVIKVEDAKRDAIHKPAMDVRMQAADKFNSSKSLATKCRITYMKKNSIVIVN
jgi:hypothetical protein